MCPPRMESAPDLVAQDNVAPASVKHSPQTLRSTSSPLPAPKPSVPLLTQSRSKQAEIGRNRPKSISLEAFGIVVSCCFYWGALAASGARSRWFESSRPDQLKKAANSAAFFAWWVVRFGRPPLCAAHPARAQSVRLRRPAFPPESTLRETTQSHLLASPATPSRHCLHAHPKSPFPPKARRSLGEGGWGRCPACRADGARERWAPQRGWQTDRVACSVVFPRGGTGPKAQGGRAADAGSTPPCRPQNTPIQTSPSDPARAVPDYAPVRQPGVCENRVFGAMSQRPGWCVASSTGLMQCDPRPFGRGIVGSCPR